MLEKLDFNSFNAILLVIGYLEGKCFALSKTSNLPLKSNLLHFDATDIASFIREGKITSEEITRTLITHIKEVNKKLNAVVEERFELALEEAKMADAQIHNASFRQQPLYGVPISVKESIHVKGMKTTGGIYHRKDLIMSEDAHVVNLLKRAGAIILCKTNTPSLCFCHETDNKLYGKTNNAWNEQKTAGGSSGGEAALIAVGGSMIGLSSDIGGSIRFPSHFNGVVGFKPGRFRVPTEGHLPADNIPLKARMSTIGPIGKSVRDTKLVYDLIAYKQERKAIYQKMTIDILPNDNGFPLNTSTGNMLTKVADFLSNYYKTSYSIPPYFNQSATVWQEIMSIDGGEEIKKLAFNTDRTNLWKYYLKEKTTKRTTTHEYLSWALIGSNLFKPTARRKNEIEDFIEEGDFNLNRYLKNRILLFPVYHRSALNHGEMYKEIFSIKKTYKRYMPYTAYANVWGLPALTIPIGFDKNKLPIGIQLISKNGNELSLFKVGEQIEKNFGGFIRSTLYDK